MNRPIKYPSLYRSLEANNTYYAMVIAPIHLKKEQIRAEKKQKIIGFYQELADIESHLREIEGGLGHKYSPDQPRNPAGQSDGGQWTSVGGGGSFVEETPKLPAGTGIIPSPPKPSGGMIVEFPTTKPDGVIMNFGDSNNEQNPVYQGAPDLPLESVYPLETILGFVFGGEIIMSIRGILGLTEGVGAAEAGATTAAETGLTEHGILRAGQRGISSIETEEAIQSAQEAGSITTQIGKYGTPQNIYRGSNGVTAVVETSGRNAGKIITIYRH